MCKEIKLIYIFYILFLLKSVFSSDDELLQKNLMKKLQDSEFSALNDLDLQLSKVENEKLRQRSIREAHSNHIQNEILQMSESNLGNLTVLLDKDDVGDEVTLDIKKKESSENNRNNTKEGSSKMTNMIFSKMHSSFQNPLSFKLASMLSIVTSTLDSIGGGIFRDNWHISFGTVLAQVRYNSSVFIPWDSGLEISVRVLGTDTSSVHLVKEMTDTLKSFQLRFYKLQSFLDKWRVIEIEKHFNQHHGYEIADLDFPHVDITLYSGCKTAGTLLSESNKKNNQCILFGCEKIRNKSSCKRSVDGTSINLLGTQFGTKQISADGGNMVFDSNIIFPTTPCILVSVPVRCPQHKEKYLNAIYGQFWNVKWDREWEPLPNISNRKLVKPSNQLLKNANVGGLGVPGRWVLWGTRDVLDKSVTKRQEEENNLARGIHQALLNIKLNTGESPNTQKNKNVFTAIAKTVEKFMPNGPNSVEKEFGLTKSLNTKTVPSQAVEENNSLQNNTQPKAKLDKHAISDVIQSALHEQGVTVSESMIHSTLANVLSQLTGQENKG